MAPNKQLLKPDRPHHRWQLFKNFSTFFMLFAILLFSNACVSAVKHTKTNNLMKQNNSTLTHDIAESINTREAAIQYLLDESSFVQLTIYNLLGQQIRTLIDSQHQSPGAHKITWNGHNDAGYEVPEGIYLYRLKIENEIYTKRLVLRNRNNAVKLAGGVAAN